MRPGDFLREEFQESMGITIETQVFRDDIARELRVGPLESAEDLEAAVALSRLIHGEFLKFGTDGGIYLTDEDMREALLALRAVLNRLGVMWEKPPFRDFTTFRSYWIRNDAAGSWQARRDILDEIFETLHDELADLESETLATTLASPVSPRGRTGWSAVDAEIAEVKRHFAAARSPQDYRNVGNDCVVVLEAVSAAAYMPDRHLSEGDVEPPVAKTKERLGQVVDVELPGRRSAEMRKLVRSAIEFAQSVKHHADGTRQSAGMSADAVIIVANLFRRISEPDG